MSDSHIKCKCLTLFTEEQFVKHFPSCKDFRQTFKNFDQQFGELLKHYSEPKENLLIIRVLLSQYISVVESKIRKNFNGNIGYSSDYNVADSHRKISSTSSLIRLNYLPDMDVDDINYVNSKPSNKNIPIEENQNNISQINHPNNIPYNIEFNNNIPINNLPKNNDFGFGDNFDSDVPCCQICKGLNITYLNCIHPICYNCFKDYARQDFPNMKCIQCKEVISEEEKKVILGDSLYGELEHRYNSLLIGSTIECVNKKCREQILFEKGHVDYNVRDEKNQKLNPEAATHYANNRCRCPRCKIDFCVECKSSPYHIGKTCIENVKIKCKYCFTIIDPSNRGPEEEVCGSSECVATFRSSCQKKLKCGHKCFGHKEEASCPPCLIDGCNNNPNHFDQNEDSYCNICFSEGLGSSPVVLLSCKHYIHHKCLETRLKKKWIGPKITFNHALCPQCNNWISCSNNPDLQNTLKETNILYEDLCKKASERFKFEGLDKDEKIKNPNSPWYKKDLEYALHKISYYMCYECKKPYFAGLRECRGGPNDIDNNNPNREYNPKDLICGAHANIAGVAGKTNCEKHGKDFIEYKCKFCCNIASWFCWGTTHFCEDCHARQCKGDYVSKYTKDKLPKCSGIDKCYLKVKHPDNGEEFALGCSVCRNNDENFKNF